MEVNVKSLWNGARTLEEAASKTSACLHMLRGLLEQERWSVVHVRDGIVRLQIHAEVLEKRGYLTAYVDFGLFAEVRRMAAGTDTMEPYTLVDEQIRTRAGLRAACDLDDMVGMRAHAAVVASVVLQRYCDAAEAESGGVLQVIRHPPGTMQVRRVPKADGKPAESRGRRRRVLRGSRKS